MSKEDGQSGMHKRRITLHDGRYLIFYTFEDEGAPAASPPDKESGAKRPEPDATVVMQAEEERRV